nr:MAG TPA: hypothetical protein [Caudoviricetes sp.]
MHIIPFPVFSRSWSRTVSAVLFLSTFLSTFFKKLRK